MTKLFARVFASLPDDAKYDEKLSEKMALIQQFVRPENLDIKPIFQNETSWLVRRDVHMSINFPCYPTDSTPFRSLFNGVALKGPICWYETGCLIFFWMRQFFVVFFLAVGVGSSTSTFFPLRSLLLYSETNCTLTLWLLFMSHELSSTHVLYVGYHRCSNTCASASWYVSIERERSELLDIYSDALYL